MRGNGRIYTRPGSPFWWIGYYNDGKQQREPAKHVRTGKKLEATDANRHEAERYLKHRIAEVTAAQLGGPAFVTPQQKRATVNDVLDALTQDFEVRGKVVIGKDGKPKLNPRIESSVKPLREHLGRRRAAELSSEAIMAFIQEQRQADYTNASINRWLQLLGQAFKLAVRTKRLSAAPFIPRLSEVGNERSGFFETEAFGIVVSQLPEYLQDFARFGFLTGWRKGSIQSLRWADVADDVIYLRAENSKTRKPETVPLEGELRTLIDRRRAAGVWQDKEGQAHFSEFVFHLNGRPIGEFRKAWATACCAAGVGQMVCPNCDRQVDAERNCSQCARRWDKGDLKYVGRIFHDLRRTAARNMVAAGVLPQVAMKITGHRTDAMFRRYAIVNEDQKREALARTQGYLAAAATQKKVLRMAAAK